MPWHCCEKPGPRGPTAYPSQYRRLDFPTFSWCPYELAPATPLLCADGREFTRLATAKDTTCNPWPLCSDASAKVLRKRGGDPGRSGEGRLRHSRSPERRPSKINSRHQGLAPRRDTQSRFLCIQVLTPWTSLTAKCCRFNLKMTTLSVLFSVKSSREASDR